MVDNVRRLRPRPAQPLPPVKLVCKRPSCTELVERAKGRPSLFCTDTCQVEYQRERAEVRRHLKAAQRLAAQYEIAPDGTSSAQPKAGALGEPARTVSPTRQARFRGDALQKPVEDPPERPRDDGVPNGDSGDPQPDGPPGGTGRTDDELLRELMHAVHLVLATLRAEEPDRAERIAADLDAAQRAVYEALASRGR